MLEPKIKNKKFIYLGCRLAVELSFSQKFAGVLVLVVGLLVLRFFVFVFILTSLEATPFVCIS